MKKEYCRHCKDELGMYVFIIDGHYFCTSDCIEMWLWQNRIERIENKGEAE